MRSHEAPARIPFATGKRTLDLALLRTFVAIAEGGSMAEAAQRIARSQPAVSLQMKKLEETVGAPLLRRNGRRLAVTETGATLLTYAKSLLDLNDEAMSALPAAGLSGSVRLGIAQDFAEGCLTSVLARFARAHPAVVVEVSVDRNAGLMDRLARRQLDLVLSFGAESSGHCELLGEVPMVWIGLPGNRADADRRLPLVVFELPCLFRQSGAAALDAAGIGWRVAFSSPSLSSHWSAVAAGLGLTVRTPLGLKPPLRILGAREGLPPLPAIAVSVHTAEKQPDGAVRTLQAIATEALLGEMAAVRALWPLQRPHSRSKRKLATGSR